MDKNKIQQIEKVQRAFKNSRVEIPTTDKPGNWDNTLLKSEKISRIMRRTSVNKKYGILLYSITRHVCPEVIIELGTSCGISTMYMASGQNNGLIYTLEGWPALAKEAQGILDRAGFVNAEVITGKFVETLPELLSKVQKLDLVYLDGDHTLEGTLYYFEICLEKVHPGSVFVMDDIHWSRDMEKAWDIIRNHKRVSLSFDLFRMGILMFKPDIPKQHYSIRY
jgi:predicted O-methyltransferase YrrM